jgi:hypothetical protein
MSERKLVAKSRLSVLIDPPLLQYARLEASDAGLSLTAFIERAIQQAVSKASMDRVERQLDRQNEAEANGVTDD